MKQCKKIRFETKKKARKALQEISETPLYLKGKFIKKARQIYECNYCKGYHITSSK